MDPLPDRREAVRRHLQGRNRERQPAHPQAAAGGEPLPPGAVQAQPIEIVPNGMMMGNGQMMGNAPMMIYAPEVGATGQAPAAAPAQAPVQAPAQAPAPQSAQQ